MNQSKRVNTIELWRFFFCMAVLGLHIGGTFAIPFFTGGYLGVEFFFILSGYGIGVYYGKHIRNVRWSRRLYELGLYIGKRLKQLYPLYFLALILTVMIRVLGGAWRASEVLSHLKNGWAEFVMMQCGPLGDEVLISADWYVASVFWGGIIVLLLLIMTKKVGGLLLCPLAGIGIYGYYFKLIGKIDVIFSYHAQLRGIAGICLGVFLCFLVNAVSERKKGVDLGLQAEGKTKPQMAGRVLYVLANLILLAVFVYTCNGHRGWKDFLVIALYWLSLFMLLLTRVQHGEKTERLFAMLGKTTYPIYILHMPVLELLHGIIG